jgi:hypothetical protein
MNRTYITAAILLAGFSQAALAFQEQGGRASPGTEATTPAANVTAPNNPLPKTGTEIRVPGLGQIGSLPKFDFGLELLYGASEPKGVREELNKTDPNDLQIRGTFKFKLPN